VAALQWLSAGRPSDAFNLGNGQGFSITEVIRASEEIAGVPVKAVTCERRPGDPPVLISDSTKARHLLGWQPRFPKLEQQISHAWRWFRDAMPTLEGN
jgi:UDP-glucose 4-epimerase